MRLGVDVGRARIGVSRSDPNGMLATPVETVARGDGDIDRILGILSDISEYGSPAVEVVVGLPLNLRGEHTASTDDAVRFAERLARRLSHGAEAPAPSVRLVDERLSTVSAHGQMRQNGRKTRDTRSVIDQAAAVVILQQALDIERGSGAPPGSCVSIDEDGGASEDGAQRTEGENAT